MSKRIVAISLFSGCGGLDIGTHWAGVPIVASIDFDKDSVETLKANRMFKNSEIFHKDITNFDLGRFKQILKTKEHDQFIVIGGPPCQPFSKAGYWIGNKSRKKDKDPRNMIGQYFRVVKELKPDGFLFENVESLLHPSNKHTVAQIEETIRNLGYKIKIFKLNAIEYGVPQKRKRLFILGSRKAFTGDLVPTHTSKDQAKRVKLEPYVTSGDVISKFNKKKYFERQEITLGGTYHEDLERVPKGKNYIALTKPPLGPHSKFKAGKRFWSFLLKLDPNEPSWTIAAQPGPWVGPFHWDSRRLRVLEIAAIQTFPEGYIFKGSRRSIQKQIGNAVPPVLAEKVVRYLLKNL